MDGATLFDEFLARVASERADVAAWIERASGEVEVLKSWLDGFRPLPREAVEELRHFSTVALTYHSNALEGNTLSQSETELVLSHGITIGGHSLVEHLEVIGHRDAMDYMQELASSDTPIGEREIKDLHALILRPVEGATGALEAGVYRTLDVRATGTGFLYPPHYLLRDAMETFVSWLGSDEAARLASVSRASEAHFRFVSIHPFRDGNGRMARLLMNLLLLRAGFPVAVIAKEQRVAYLDALVRGQQGGEGAAPLTELVEDAVRESLLETLRLLATARSSRGHNAPFYRALLEAPN